MRYSRRHLRGNHEHTLERRSRRSLVRPNGMPHLSGGGVDEFLRFKILEDDPADNVKEGISQENRGSTRRCLDLNGHLLVSGQPEGFE